ncbi:tetratricopeptide repeat family protein [Chlamydia ibidis 10-1398/6]|nr:tetratricopeptide repeat family protein [Chlamydia ibidis 10-1398/6]
MSIVCLFLLEITLISSQGQGIEKKVKCTEKFWNLDPYSLEGLSAHFLMYSDCESQKQLLRFFPILSSNEVPILCHAIMYSKNPEYNFSSEEIDVIKKLNSLEGVSLACACGDSDLNPDKDLARALIFAEFPEKEAKIKADYYTVYLDILALRIYVQRLRHIDKCHAIPGSEEFHRFTIEAINKILFYEEGIRYPSKKEMFSDEFSFLSSVTDKKFGVCLGVSSLYYSLSQRLYLPLEAVTPPGHIYLRYLGGKINIETTAGGRHLSTDHYCDCLSIEDLRIRSPKEFIGLTFVNQGSFALQRNQYANAELAYTEAIKYIDDEEVKELLGIAKILNGKTSEGKILLQNSSQVNMKGSVSYDYLNGNIDKSTLALLFSYPGDSFTDSMAYYEKLKKAIKQSPKCSECRRRLASIALHLGKVAEGIILLEQCAKESPDDMVLHLKLCKMHLERHDYAKADEYFKKAQELMNELNINWREGKSYTLFLEIFKKISTISP